MRRHGYDLSRSRCLWASLTLSVSREGMVDLDAVLEAGERLATSYRKLSPFFIPSILGNMPAGHLSIQHGLRGYRLC